MTTDISICNSALAIIGADDDGIQTFADNTRQARICSQLYTTTKEKMLAMHPWNFAVGQVTLARLVATPLFNYSYGYQLPTDPKLIKIIRTENGGEDYKIFEDKLYSNYSTLDITYLFDPGEAQFPAYFTRALELEMAVLLAIALQQDTDFADGLEVLARKNLKQAKFTDSTNEPPKNLRGNNLPLTSVR